MKGIMKKAALLAVAMTMSAQADAQLSNVLKNAASGLLGGGNTANTAVNAVTDIVGNLLGTNKVSKETLTGTWKYSEPCVVFESEDVLTSLGSTAVSGKVENTLATQLTKLGFTKGKVVMTLKEDGTGTVTYGTKTANINWAVNETTLTLTFPVTKKSVNMNVKISGGNLQVAMNAEKLLTLVNAVTSKVNTASTLGTVSALIKNVKGMYVGLKFTK